MSLETLQERLSALQETTAQLRDLIDRLASLQFEPGAVPLSIEEDGSPSSELSAEISSLLRSGMEDQQLLLEEAKYVRPEGGEKTRLQNDIEKAGGGLFSCRSALRKARLCAKQSLERAQRLERELMIQAFIEPTAEEKEENQTKYEETTTTTATRPAPHPPRRAPTPRYGRTTTSTATHPNLSEKDRQTVNASSNLTTALQRTHMLMTSELTRSEFAHQMLKESSEALGRLDESYVSLDGMLASSRDLLGTLLRSQKSDTWYLQTARFVLLGTLAWLVFRRLLYGPLWWVVWLPLRILFGMGIRAGSAVVSKTGGGDDVDGRGEGGGYEKSKVSVDGLPDESLPTAKVGDDDDEDVLEVVINLASENQTSDESLVDKAGEPGSFQGEKTFEEGVEAGTHRRDEL